MQLACMRTPIIIKIDIAIYVQMYVEYILIYISYYQELRVPITNTAYI